MDKKINVRIKRDVFEHPNFQENFLKLVASIEEQILRGITPNLKCINCGHRERTHLDYNGIWKCMAKYPTQKGTNKYYCPCEEFKRSNKEVRK